MKKQYGLFAMMLAALMFSMASVAACSCIIPGTPLEEMNNSYSVFSGKVVEMKENSFDLTYDVTLEVQDIWKGPNQEKVTVKTGQDSAMCGYPFEINKTYLVYAHEFEGEINANLCGRTALVQDAAGDITELGSPQTSNCAGRCGVNKVELSFFQAIKAWFSRLFN